MENEYLDAKAALNKLKDGNKRYMETYSYNGDVSRDKVSKGHIKGQKPYAVILTCSDSRVIPEGIFSAGIGELFVIRVAGNVVDPHQLGSLQYAIEHLGTKLILVMGHRHCGAVNAAITGGVNGPLAAIINEIKEAIGAETSDYPACKLNVEHSIARIKNELELRDDIEVKGAIYDISDGSVEFFD